MKYAILVSLLTMTSCYAMEHKKINGYVTIDPYECAWYSIDAQKDVARDLGITIAPNEPMIFVVALDEFMDTLLIHDFKEFPSALPLYMLKDKKEGDIIDIKTPQGEIALTCSQKKVIPNATFEDAVRISLRKFKKKPKVHLFSEKELEDSQIIAFNENGKWTHGPNGYPFTADMVYSDDSFDDSQDESIYDSDSSIE